MELNKVFDDGRPYLEKQVQVLQREKQQLIEQFEEFRAKFLLDKQLKFCPQEPWNMPNLV
jgi:hypothetical protein